MLIKAKIPRSIPIFEILKIPKPP